MKLYKQRNGKAWSMRFVFEGQRIEQTTGHTNLRKAEAYAEAFRTRLRNEGVGIIEKKPIPNSKMRWRTSLHGPYHGKRKILPRGMKLPRRL